MNRMFTLAATTLQDKNATEMTEAMHGIAQRIISMGYTLFLPMILLVLLSFVLTSLDNASKNSSKNSSKNFDSNTGNDLEKEKQIKNNDLDRRTQIANAESSESSVDHQEKVDSWDKMVAELHASPELKSQLVEDVRENPSVEETVLENILTSKVATTKMKERAETLIPHFRTPTNEEIQLKNEQEDMELDLITLERILNARIHLEEIVSPSKDKS